METQYTDFQNALRTGDLEISKALLSAHPKWVNEAGDSGFPPLVLAAYYDHTELVKLLLENNAAVDAKDKSGNTALMGACFKGFREVVELLLNNGADVNVQNYNGATALTFASTFNQKEIALELLAKGADPTLKDNRGLSPLDHAKMQGLSWAEEVLTV
ncbi:MAG: hypothetical protein CL843_19050 [Crocinitomicaceae bacterium]|nr:hypothetical protein [Crocinitomicaceae bacterium]|tara:strand:- start:1734 stop:2210 length:477 start_codon:yes stop_codon:yes gene_type:complete